MKKFCFAALAATACMLAAPPAYADPPNDGTITGGCVARTTYDTVGGGVRVVTSSGFAAAYSPTAGHNPVTLTSLTCRLVVNGSTVATYPGTEFGSVGVVAPQTYFGTSDSDNVVICTDWATRDAHVQANGGTFCDGVTAQGVPPTAVFDAIELIVCTITNAIAPTQVDGLLHIPVGGDVYVLGIRVFNCFPY